MTEKINKRSKIKFNKRKTLSFILICTFIITGIIPVVSSAQVNNKPQLEVSVNVSPNPAIVDENITVSGTITPQPFEIDIPAKEIVLVLDVSSSMNDEISNVKCENTSGKCSIHKKEGKHNTTKIHELKKAAINFVEKMKDVKNLKIGIVTYSNISDIKISGNKSLIPSNEVDTLKEIINTIETGRGTNIGEGIRRGLYLLNESSESNPEANKTLILMSDGAPYGYSEGINNNKYYEIIDNSRPSYKGNDSTGGKEYSKIMATKVNEYNNNAFTIGYGMNFTEIQTMREIHANMIGLSSNNNSTINKNNGFFETDGNAIEAVFSQIADTILNNLEITDIELELLNENFTIDIGGREIKLNDIRYKKVRETSSKIRYEADPFDFSFTMQCSKPGYYENIFEGSTITFPWKGENIVTYLPPSSLEVKDNQLPNIQAQLLTPQFTQLDIDQEVNVRYSINPEEFEFNSNNDDDGPKDVVFLIDVSNDMFNSQKLTNVCNGIDNQLVSKYANKENVNMAFILYSNDAKIMGSNENPFSNIQGELHKKIIEIKDEVIGEGRNIEKAIVLAKEILEGQYSNPDASKNIIMISSGEVNNNYSDEEIVSDGYNIISVELQKEKNVSIQSFYSLHSKLGGAPDRYVSSIPDGGQHNALEGVMKKVADMLEASRKSVYKFENSNLAFDVGTGIEFTSIEGATITKGDEVSTANVTIDNSNVVIDLPTITYRYDSGSYKSIPFTVDFNVKVKNTGKITFAKNESESIKNYIEYDKINGTRLPVAIQTPIFYVKNNIPVVNAILNTPSNVNANINDDIRVGYTIQPEDFNYSNFESVSKDIVILLDTSIDNEDMFNKIKEKISSKILLGLFSENENINVNIITFDSLGNVNSITDGFVNDFNVASTKLLEVEPTENEEANIVEAVLRANDSLTNRVSTNKTIVMVSLGDIKNWSEQQSNLLAVKNNKYNIITTVLPVDNQSNSIVADNVNGLHRYLHEDNQNVETDYISSVEVGIANNIEEGFINKLKESINTRFLKEYVLRDVVINFSLPTGFEVISGLNDDNKYLVQDIKYNLVNQGDTKVMKSNNFDIDFTIKNPNVGQYQFGSKNNIEYIGVDAISELSHDIETPVINLYNVNHGIYLGNGNINNTDENNIFSNEALVQMAGKFEVSGSRTTVNLEISEHLTLNDAPIVYRLTEDKKLIKLKEMTVSSDNSKKYICTFTENEVGRMIMLYNVKLPSTSSINEFTNRFNVNSISRPYTIKSNNQELPDLF